MPETNLDPATGPSGATAGGSTRRRTLLALLLLILAAAIVGGGYISMRHRSNAAAPAVSPTVVAAHAPAAVPNAAVPTLASATDTGAAAPVTDCKRLIRIDATACTAPGQITVQQDGLHFDPACTKLICDND